MGSFVIWTSKADSTVRLNSIVNIGLRADLVVISGDHNKHFRALVGAGPEDVQLVVIAGVPLYGDVSLTTRFWEMSDLEELPLPVRFGRKVLASGPTAINLAALATRLATAMQGEGLTLAPLAGWSEKRK